MGCRAVRAVVALTALATACGVGDRIPAGGGSGNGTVPYLSAEARAVIGAPRRTQVRATWLLRKADCFTCLTPAGELRRLGRGAAAAVSVRVVVVGGGAAEVRALMRRQRIAAEVTAMTPGGYRRAFGRLPLPGVYVARGDSLVAAWFGSHAARAEIRLASLDALAAAPPRARSTPRETRGP